MPHMAQKRPSEWLSPGQPITYRLIVNQSSYPMSPRRKGSFGSTVCAFLIAMYSVASPATSTTPTMLSNTIPNVLIWSWC